MSAPALVCLLLVAAPRGPVIPPAEKAAAKVISAQLLRAHTRFLASDLLEGRGPATRGDELGQAYIVSQLEALGVEPAAPGGGWLQPFDLVSVSGNPKSMRFAGGGKK